jgi:hypothetical protein
MTEDDLATTILYPHPNPVHHQCPAEEQPQCNTITEWTTSSTRLSLQVSIVGVRPSSLAINGYYGGTEVVTITVGANVFLLYPLVGVVWFQVVHVLNY